MTLNYDTVEIVALRDEYVICRGIGHSWDDNPTGEVDSTAFAASTGLLMLRCTRCSTERFDYVDDHMMVWRRYYRYPAQYRSIPGQGTRPNLRAEMLRRSLLIRTYQPEPTPEPNGRRPRRSTRNR